MPGRDFMGQLYGVGDFVAAGGRGNVSAEYGMILYEVLEVEPKLKLRRLTIKYPAHTMESAVVGWHKVTVKNPNKYVKVTPLRHVEDLFHRAVQGDLRGGEAQMIGRWIHGSSDSKDVFAGLPWVS
jgi:hypothetical protein